MNRQQRRQTERRAVRDRNRTTGIAGVLRSTGMKVRLSGDQLTKAFARQVADTVKPGEHVWAMFMVHRVNPATMHVDEPHFDTESLLMITGPGCYLCETTWKPGAEDTRCPGEPPGVLGYLVDQPGSDE